MPGLVCYEHLSSSAIPLSCAGLFAVDLRKKYSASRTILVPVQTLKKVNCMKTKEKFEPAPIIFATQEEWVKRVEAIQQEIAKAKEKKKAAQGPAEYGLAVRFQD